MITREESGRYEVIGYQCSGSDATAVVVLDGENRGHFERLCALEEVDEETPPDNAGTDLNTAESAHGARTDGNCEKQTKSWSAALERGGLPFKLPFAKMYDNAETILATRLKETCPSLADADRKKCAFLLRAYFQADYPWITAVFTG